MSHHLTREPNKNQVQKFADWVTKRCAEIKDDPEEALKE